MPPAIRIENLGKRYRVNHAVERAPYRTLRDSLASAATAPLRRLRSGGHNGTVEDFWALRDISFDVQPGEVVGIIGRNGAGKSTLLKILSRITKPTTGRVTLRGRVGSLLEVGTGFHPELTGRENVYLNGGILGMSRAEIKRNFDAIVDFSGVEKFLDTPVKRYSSGMQVRLAFAVAAHLDPEILIVDEVLAVGDAEFQKKCLGKMGEVSRGGRTVFFVSHNMAAIVQLTRCVVHLRDGLVQSIGPTDAIVEEYLASFRNLNAPQGVVATVRRGNEGLSREAEFVELHLDNTNGVYSTDAPIVVVATLRVTNKIDRVRISGTVFRRDGTPVGSFFSHEVDVDQQSSYVKLQLELTNLGLAPGHYHFGLATGVGNNIVGHKDYDILRECLAFEIEPPLGEAGIVSVWPSNWGAVRFATPELRMAQDSMESAAADHGDD